ncbi:hypothetical protein G9F71_017890 [Clostridium sp. FP2]|uniref:hypothetical protein n=1 Tax=Clostridium sp. FP2 TaxID=2724481 RepID=UPI0013E942CC|nr:hypothetical protein [Clostridium sp. FP2]MBZ9624725.1 hypothetical protein [Clostridium sp. FP2]
MIDERLKIGLYNLSKATLPSEVLNAWCLMGDSKKDKCAIISLEGYDKNIYSKALNRLINSDDSHFMTYFESDKLYFIDDELLAGMFKNNNADVKFKIDYSLMLDTNYSSYIHTFVNNDDCSHMNNEIFNTIDILIREDFNFDYLFYIIENYKNSFCNSKVDNIIPIQDMKAAVYQNLVSLELFKNIDKKEYCDNGTIKYNISKQECYLIVDGFFSEIFSSAAGKDTMEVFLNIHKGMVLFLIGVFKIRFESKSDSQYKIRELFKYMNSITGIYLQREMIIAHQYFMNPTNVQIINKVNKGMNENKLYKSIENIAWDFAVPRIMEFFLKTRGEGRYFIPLFLTNDKNLRNLLRLHKIKGVTFNKDGTQFIPISSINSQEYFEEHKCNVDFDSLFNDEAIKKRNEKLEHNKKTKFKCVEVEFFKLVKVMECK